MIVACFSSLFLLAVSIPASEDSCRRIKRIEKYEDEEARGEKEGWEMRLSDLSARRSDWKKGIETQSKERVNAEPFDRQNWPSEIFFLSPFSSSGRNEMTVCVVCVSEPAEGYDFSGESAEHKWQSTKRQRIHMTWCDVYRSKKYSERAIKCMALFHENLKSVCSAPLVTESRIELFERFEMRKTGGLDTRLRKKKHHWNPVPSENSLSHFSLFCLSLCLAAWKMFPSTQKSGKTSITSFILLISLSCFLCVGLSSLVHFPAVSFHTVFYALHASSTPTFSPSFHCTPLNGYTHLTPSFTHTALLFPCAELIILGSFFLADTLIYWNTEYGSVVKDVVGFEWKNWEESVAYRLLVRSKCRFPPSDPSMSTIFPVWTKDWQKV